MIAPLDLASVPPPHAPILPEAQPLPAMVEGRDAMGRFTTGNSGRPRNARHRVTVAIETMMENQWERITMKVIDQALRGDTAAQRLVMERVSPVRRGVAVVISDFPKIESVADVPTALAAILAAAAAGEITADEVAPLVTILSAYSASMDSAMFAERLEALEKEIESTRLGTK
ncbi:hypothetical protein [Tardiphaga sp.]|uniref:hypothetical protein n=1 Tax=Tardiphaga sp. TaxID=1926292 RepID=UPI0026213D29|nr:hypothetical protein [Tardiphaga sp.]MDB5616106.1 hypothetical protein [Tardiphaga sp.]